MCSVAICVCSSFVFMGRTKHVPCPSAVLLSVVPTKPCYTIVPVFVKGRCLLLEMFLARHVGAGLARQHLLAAGCAPPVLLPSTRVPGSLALGTRAQLPRGVGCEAKKRGAKSSLLHLAGGPLAAPAVGCPPHNEKPGYNHCIWWRIRTAPASSFRAGFTRIRPSTGCSRYHTKIWRNWF